MTHNINTYMVSVKNIMQPTIHDRFFLKFWYSVVDAYTFPTRNVKCWRDDMQYDWSASVTHNYHIYSTFIFYNVRE